MAYSCRVYGSFADVPTSDWREVCPPGRSRIFMDPRFVATVEASLGRMSRLRHLVFHDEHGRAVACASLSSWTVELANLTGPRAASTLRALPGFLTAFANVSLLMCGLPVSVGSNSLAFAPTCDPGQVLDLLDDTMGRIARAERQRVVAYKEFGPKDAAVMDRLLGRGYCRIETPPAHVFERRFDSFQAYCASLRSHYRKEVRRSTRKLERAGVKVVVINDPARVLAAYTPGLHELYLDMVRRAAMKLEMLPIEFFRELVLRFGDCVDLILLIEGARTLALAWCLHLEDTYFCLFGGVDHERNADLDLYFNLVYGALDAGLRRNVARIEVGQTAEGFKARLGCGQEKLFAYARGVGWPRSWLIKHGANLLVHRLPPAPTRHVYASRRPSSIHIDNGARTR
jgi:predicted N-acyltransferase